MDESDVPTPDAANKSTDESSGQETNGELISENAPENTEKTENPEVVPEGDAKTAEKEDSEIWEDITPNQPDFEVNSEALERLFAILGSSDEEVNYVLAGYLNSVMTSFIKSETEVKNAILNYFYTSETLADEMINHLYCRSIAILLSNFLNVFHEEQRSFDSLKAKEEQEKEQKSHSEARIAIF